MNIWATIFTTFEIGQVCNGIGRNAHLIQPALKSHLCQASQEAKPSEVNILFILSGSYVPSSIQNQGLTDSPMRGRNGNSHFIHTYKSITKIMMLYTELYINSHTLKICIIHYLLLFQYPTERPESPSPLGNMINSLIELLAFGGQATEQDLLPLRKLFTYPKKFRLARIPLPIRHPFSFVPDSVFHIIDLRLSEFPPHTLLYGFDSRLELIICQIFTLNP
ncbi:hypothetical protein NXV08_00180 (plasmid) [Bacteroides fragilis]|nr:hypothetical protein [Bacteroides fragilis]